MKKFVLLIAVTFGIALSVSSCKTHETCPAYGQVSEIEQPNC